MPYSLALDDLPPEAGRDVLRTAFVARARAYLTGARAAAEELLIKEGGFACARALSEAQDKTIEALYTLATTRLYPNPNPSTGEKVAVLAVGGYGRGTLAPGSDIDILFLLPVSTPWGESIAEAMLYALWDLGLKVGHATRTLDECIRAGREDLTVRTALLESRYLAGNDAVFAQFLTRFEKQVMVGRSSEFVHAKLAERDERVRRAGQSRYLVEPNVKEGKGGFRDLQTLYWIVKFVYLLRKPEDIVRVGVFTAQELRLFMRCEEFLWRVRCHLHFMTGRAEERLSFDLQRQIAQRMGYHDRTHASAVERFMKHYFLVAKTVGDLSTIVSAALEAKEQKPKAMLDRFMKKLRFTRQKRALRDAQDFVLEKDRLTIAKPDVFTRDPVNLIRLFWVADRDQLAIHPDASRAVTRALRLIDQNLRDNKEANALFLDILTSKDAPDVVLRLMHETGVLGRFIPDFARISAMMEFSMYHHYTVDEHIFRCIGILSRIDHGDCQEEHPLSHTLLQNLHNRRALYVALFLHDIGKGRGGEHEIIGANIARALCPRLGLTQAEADLVIWLVEHHLLMSQTAQSRDIGDPRTIASFAEEVQTLERLRLLLILTVCDIRGVGPGVWNGWKGQLLRSLYHEAEMLMTGDYSGLERSARIEAAQAVLRHNLPEWADDRFANYLTRHNATYWIKVERDKQVSHARLIEKMEQTGERFQIATETDVFRGVTELTLLAIDHPRLLSIIFGACAAAGANIVEAQIFTTNDGFALDSITISRAFTQDNDELRRAVRVANHMIATLKGEVRLPDIIASRSAQNNTTQAFNVTPDVLLDNALSAKSTVLEITALDRPGLLYALTTEIGKLNINVNSARIVTYGEKAVDVFYVTDLTGGKITQPDRQKQVRERLLRVINPLGESEHTKKDASSHISGKEKPMA